MNKENLQQLRLAVEELVKQGDIDAAIEKCRDYLQFDRSDQVIELIERLEKVKEETNREIVETAIKKTDHLWDEKQYGKLYDIYMRLYSLTPKNKKLENLIVKVRNEIQESEHGQIKDAAETAEEKIKKLWNDGKYKDVYLACNEVLEFDYTNRYALKMVKEAEKKYFDQLIQEVKKRHYGKGDYSGAVKEFADLVRKFGENKHLLRALIESDQKLIKDVKDSNEKAINEGIEKINKLIDEKEYSDAMLALLKLQEIDPRHKKIQAVKREVQRKLDDQLDDDIVAHIIEMQKQMIEEYKRNPEGFVRI